MGAADTLQGRLPGSIYEAVRVLNLGSVVVARPILRLVTLTLRRRNLPDGMADTRSSGTWRQVGVAPGSAGGTRCADQVSARTAAWIAGSTIPVAGKAVSDCNEVGRIPAWLPGCRTAAPEALLRLTMVGHPRRRQAILSSAAKPQLTLTLRWFTAISVDWGRHYRNDTLNRLLRVNGMPAVASVCRTRRRRRRSGPSDGGGDSVAEDPPRELSEHRQAPAVGDSTRSCSSDSARSRAGHHSVALPTERLGVMLTS